MWYQVDKGEVHIKWVEINMGGLRAVPEHPSHPCGRHLLDCFPEACATFRPQSGCGQMATQVMSFLSWLFWAPSEMSHDMLVPLWSGTSLECIHSLNKHAWRSYCVLGNLPLNQADKYEKLVLGEGCYYYLGNKKGRWGQFKVAWVWNWDRGRKEILFWHL